MKGDLLALGFVAGILVGTLMGAFGAHLALSACEASWRSRLQAVDAGYYDPKTAQFIVRGEEGP